MLTQQCDPTSLTQKTSSHVEGTPDDVRSRRFRQAARAVRLDSAPVIDRAATWSSVSCSEPASQGSGCAIADMRTKRIHLRILWFRKFLLPWPSFLALRTFQYETCDNEIKWIAVCTADSSKRNRVCGLRPRRPTGLTHSVGNPASVHPRHPPSMDSTFV
jgi:hypothetical protein